MRTGLCPALGVVLACVGFLLSFLTREQTTSAVDVLMATVVAIMVGVAVGGCLGAAAGWIWLIVSVNREHGREREPRRCPTCGRAAG